MDMVYNGGFGDDEDLTLWAKPSRIPKGVANKERERERESNLCCCWGATTLEVTS